VARKLQVEIIGDASSLHRAFGQAADSGSRFGGVLAGVGKAAAFAVGGAALGGLAVTLRAGISDWKESAKVTAQTEAVIKSTGGAAGVTARGVDKLARTIQNYSGMDDEAIKSTENLLLTFTNIRNAAGKNNDVFNQATKAAADMSVALGQDLKSSAIQLGKALNDPVKGITALRRVGVAFSADQIDLIKNLTESGKTMQAQKVVLAELNKEFGGSAEAVGKTLPGQLNILKETFNNLAGDLVGKAVPALTSFTGFLTSKGLPAIQDAFGAISNAVGPAIQGLGEAFKQAGPAIMQVLEPLAAVVRDDLVPIFNQLQAVGARAITAVSAIIKENGPELRQIFANLGEVISNLAKVVVPLLDFAFTKVLPVAIKILIPVLVLVTDAIAKISTVVRILAVAIESTLVGAWNLLAGAVNKTKGVLDTLSPVFTVVQKAVGVLADIVKATVVAEFNVWAGAVRLVSDAIRTLVGFAGDALSKLAKLIAKPLATMTAAFGALGDAVGYLKGLIQGLLDQADNLAAAASKIASAVGAVKGAFGAAAGLIPGRAIGGPVRAGSPYIVGERGPELFVPRTSGQIVPGGMSGGTPLGGGATYVFNFPNYVGTRQELVDEVRRGLYEVNRRNPGAIPGVA
jgi:hypothetical protein